MHKNYVRSYRITAPGDAEAADQRGGEICQFSAHYEGVLATVALCARDCIDVFRFSDG